ncbi:MAG: hypothetical protein OHK0012_06510 [Synechococcales cyanobacterium]
MFQTALFFSPSLPDTHSNLGSALAHLGQPVEAVAHFQIELSHFNRDPQTRAKLHFNVGQALAQSGQYAHAEVSYRQTIEDDPTLLDAYLALARLATTQQHWKTACSILGQARELFPLSADVSYALGTLAVAQHQYHQAIPLFTTAIAQKPTWAEAHHGLALVLLKVDRFHQGILELERAILLNPKDPVLYRHWLMAVEADPDFQSIELV